MKLQIQGQSLRFRIDEAELAQLLAGAALVNSTELGAGQSFRQSLRLKGIAAPALAISPESWDLTLPEEVVRAYVTQLPCRAALHLELPLPEGRALSVHFEVDVRDSVRRRGPPKKVART